MAMKVRCLAKNRDSKGNIVNYNLVDETGRKFQATGKQIKEEFKKGQFEFVNLQIDKAGRLVDKAEEKPKKVEGSKTKVGMTGVLTVLSRNGKKVEHTTPKDIVKEFLATINERYNDDEGKDLFEDYNGTWWLVVERKYHEPMPKEVKVYFKILVDSLIKKAKEDYVKIYNPYDEVATINEFMNNSKLSEEVVKFQKLTNCDVGIIKGIFKLAAQAGGKTLAHIGFEENITYGWVHDYELLTSDYAWAKKYIVNVLELVSEYTSEGQCMDVDVTGNDLGQIFYIKYLAEVSGRTVDFYKQQILGKVKRFIELGIHKTYFSVPTKEELVYWALSGGLVDVDRPEYTDKEVKQYGIAYIALKYGIMYHGDEDTEYCNIARKEAAELVKQL